MKKKEKPAGQTKEITTQFEKGLMYIKISSKTPEDSIIFNNFGLSSVVGMASPHFVPKDPTKRLPIKTVFGEVSPKIARDQVGRLSILARKIRDCMVAAFPLAIKERDNIIYNATAFRKMVRVYGIDSPHFCPISFADKDFFVRLDPCVQANGGTSNTMRGAARNWSLNCIIEFDAARYDNEKIWHLITHAGAQVGLGAWTPEHNGTNGLFKVETVSPMKKDKVSQPKNFNARFCETGFKRFLKEEDPANYDMNCKKMGLAA